jgi:hypothetical protein
MPPAPPELLTSAEASIVMFIPAAPPVPVLALPPVAADDPPLFDAPPFSPAPTVPPLVSLEPLDPTEPLDPMELPDSPELAVKGTSPEPPHAEYSEAAKSKPTRAYRSIDEPPLRLARQGSGATSGSMATQRISDHFVAAKADDRVKPEFGIIWAGLDRP